MTAVQSELPPHLSRLSNDAEIWQQMDIDAATRAQILRYIAEGHPAIAFKTLGLKDSAAGNNVFRKKHIAGEFWLVPQRFERMVDFFVRRSEAAQPSASSADITALLASEANCLLTGGPGTGKSFQIAALVNHLAQQPRERPLRITIAAPTGKAAARHSQLKSTGGVVVQWSTIHRLLGLSGDFSGPRFHSRHPLGVDLLIVDEISMVNLGLFTTLIAALPDHARVILAGDLGQLPAVEGMSIDCCLSMLENCKLVTRVHLTKVFRFSETKSMTYQRIAQSGLAAINAASEGVTLHQLKNAAECRALLERNAAERFESKTARNFRRHLAGGANREAPDTALAADIFSWLKEQIVLTTRREGMLGSIALNTVIQDRVARRAGERVLVPIIATSNNYRLGIFNGDTGFIAPLRGREFAFMESSEGGVLTLPLPELRSWQPAYAITVHKSQGSEYGEVWVVYEESAPDHVQLNDNRLLYTAVTRAKNHAHVLQIKVTSTHPSPKAENQVI